MRYQIVTYSFDYGGMDEKKDYPTLREARKACRTYCKEYEGAAIFDYKKQQYIEMFNYFPIDLITDKYKGTPKQYFTMESAA